MGVSPRGPPSGSYFEGAGPAALEDLFRGGPREGEGEEGGETETQRADFSAAGPGPGSSVDMGGADDVLREVSEGKADPGLTLALDLGVNVAVGAEAGRRVRSDAKGPVASEGSDGAMRAGTSNRRAKRSENETAKASERRRRKLQRQEKKMGLPPGALREGTKAKNLSAMLSSKAAGSMRHAGGGLLPGYAGFPHGYHGVAPDHRAPFTGMPYGPPPRSRSSSGGRGGSAGRNGVRNQVGLVPAGSVSRKDVAGASTLVQGMPATKGRRGRPRSTEGTHHAMSPHVIASSSQFPSTEHGVAGMGFGIQPDFEQVALAHASQAAGSATRGQAQTSKRARSKAQAGRSAPPAQDAQHPAHGGLYSYPAGQQPGQQNMGAMMAAMGYFQGGGPPGPNGAQGHAAVHWPPSTFPPAYASWAYLTE